MYAKARAQYTTMAIDLNISHKIICEERQT